MSAGRRYYGLSQVAEGLGIDWRILKELVNNDDLERKLGFTYVFDSYSERKFFPVEAIRKLYRYRDRVLSKK